MEVRHCLTKKDLKSYLHFREKAKGEPSNSRSISFISAILKALQHILKESIIENMEVNRTVRCSVIGCTKLNRQFAVVWQLYCFGMQLRQRNHDRPNRGGLLFIQNNTIVKKHLNPIIWRLGRSVKHIRT